MGAVPMFTKLSISCIKKSRIYRPEKIALNVNKLEREKIKDFIAKKCTSFFGYDENCVKKSALAALLLPSTGNAKNCFTSY